MCHSCHLWAMRYGMTQPSTLMTLFRKNYEQVTLVHLANPLAKQVIMNAIYCGHSALLNPIKLEPKSITANKSMTKSLFIFLCFIIQYWKKLWELHH